MIKNTSKNTLLSNNLKHCNSFFSKCKGLMFTKKLTDKALIFTFNKEKKHSLHMFFVFYPIDVLWLDSKKQVVDLKENFKPFSIATPKNPATFIIELPQNTINTTKTELGDTIQWD